MSQRMVLIPWEEYHKLKARLVGGGSAPEDKDSSGGQETIPPPDEVILKSDPRRITTSDQPKESNTPTLPDTSPPGILAREWLTWM